MEYVDATVLKVYDITSRQTKTWDEFRSRKVLIEFNSEKDYPDRIVLEQGWDKKLDVVSHVEEWKKYRFYLWYRANERTDKNWVDTAFWSISARRIEDLNWATSNWQSDLPF